MPEKINIPIGTRILFTLTSGKKVTGTIIAIEKRDNYCIGCAIFKSDTPTPGLHSAFNYEPGIKDRFLYVDNYVLKHRCTIISSPLTIGIKELI